jgi:hypothetical protein
MQKEEAIRWSRPWSPYEKIAPGVVRIGEIKK